MIHIFETNFRDRLDIQWIQVDTIHWIDMLSIDPLKPFTNSSSLKRFSSSRLFEQNQSNSSLFSAVCNLAKRERDAVSFYFVNFASTFWLLSYGAQR